MMTSAPRCGHLAAFDSGKLQAVRFLLVTVRCRAEADLLGTVEVSDGRGFVNTA